MYDIAKLEYLAADEEFVQQVRTLARDILTHGRVAPGATRHLGPLTCYGPRNAGSVLRLTTLDSWTSLDGELQVRRTQLLGRVETARV